jgi:hypothetical protein
MEVTEQNILDVELAINTLVQQKEKLVFDKKEVDLKNSILNNQVRSGGKIQDTKYKKICEEQNKLKKSGLQIERAISSISMEIIKKNGLKEQLKLEFKKHKNIETKERLVQMRDYYINFASDKTRVASMRAMGAEFAEKLESLIKTL